MNLMDAVRVLLSLVMLGYTSWIDLRTREVLDLIWAVFGALALLLDLYEVYIGNLTVTGLAFPVLFSTVLAIALGYMGLFGGADAEAFVVLALIHPYQPRGLEPVLGVVSTVYPLTLFSNSALAGVSFALVLLVRNLVFASRKESLFGCHVSDSWWRKLILMFTGLKISMDSVKGPPFQYPLELPAVGEGSTRRLVVLPDISDDEAARMIFQHLRDEGVEEVWVSHTLPFLMFITIGYISSLLLGDVALYVLRIILFR